MNPNLAIANKVCMVILNFEVINSYRLLALLNIMCFNDKIFTVNTYEFITYEKTFCLDKSSALYTLPGSPDVISSSAFSQSAK